MEAPRKRVRRDTKRCYECRRRKVKCQMTSESVELCSECVKMGLICSTQAPAEQPAPDPGHDLSIPLEQSDRLSRIEEMLQRIVSNHEKLDTMEASAALLPTMQAMTDPSTSLHTSLNQSIPADAFYYNFDKHPISMTQTTEREPLARKLLELLPSPRDAVTICSNTKAWMLELPTDLMTQWRPTNRHLFRQTQEIAGKSNVQIAKCLLFFALCMLHMPPEFDENQLEIRDPEAASMSYVKAVSSFILSEEEYARSSDGVECLIMIGLIRIASFDLLSAWLSFRRAVDIGRVLGFDGVEALESTDPMGASPEKQHHMWLSAVMSECYCSLLLGMESSVGPMTFGPETEAEAVQDPDVHFRKRVWNLSLQFCKGNMFEPGSAVEVTKTINSALDALESSVPSSWWRTPLHGNERSQNAAAHSERRAHQIWFYQLRILANLRYVMYTGMEPSARSFRHQCLESSRIALHHYTSIRLAGNSQMHFRVFDIMAFMAATTLIMASVAGESSDAIDPHAFRRRSDMILVEQITESMRELGKASSCERVARQSAEVLSALLSESMATSTLDDMASDEADAQLPWRSNWDFAPFATQFSSEADGRKLNATNRDLGQNGAMDLLLTTFKKVLADVPRVQTLIRRVMGLVRNKTENLPALMDEDELLNILLHGLFIGPSADSAEAQSSNIARLPNPRNKPQSTTRKTALSMGATLSLAWPPKPSFTENDVPDLQGRIFIVTGASSGIGKELTKLLYLRNAKVYLASRTESNVLQAMSDIRASAPQSQGDVRFLHIDMEDLNSVKSAAAEFKAQEDRLDVLWHNAGSFPPAGSKTKQGYELQLGVHCIAPHLFTELLTPIMERTAAERKPGTVRVAWVSSAGAEYLSPSGGGVGIDNLDYHKPASNLTQYGISKAGMILLSQEYAKRHRSAGIVHVALNPGILSTGLTRHFNAFMRYAAHLATYNAVNGAYTELYAGLSPDIDLALSGSWVIPWGSIGMVRQDIADAGRSVAEGGSGIGEEFWTWCNEQVKEFKL